MIEGMNNELITVREAAKECGRNMETVRRWIWSGNLPARKLGNQLFIKRGDLVTYCRLSARNLPAKIAEKAVREYNAKVRITEKPKNMADFIKRSRKLRQQIRARIGRDFTEDEITGEIHRMREERMNQIEQSLQDWKREAEAGEKEDFLERAIAFRNRLKARGYPETSTAELVMKSREGRMRELRQSLRRH